MLEAALILAVAYGFVALVLAFLWARAVVEECEDFRRERPTAPACVGTDARRGK